MVRRVGVRTLALALFLALGSTAWAALPKHAGLAAAVQERWYVALKRLPAADEGSRAERYFRALALLGSGQKGAAFDALRALAGDKGSFSGPALEQIVAFQFADGRYAQVVKDHEAGGATKFMEPEAHFYRVGQSYYMLGDHEKAQPLLEQADAGKWRAYARHTLALIAYGRGMLSVAVERVGEALDAAQSHPDRAVRRAMVDRLRLVRGRMIHQAALSTVEIDPSRREKLIKLAISQLSLIKKESPYYAEALRTIGWCAAELNDVVRALASFELAASVDPDNAHEDAWATGRIFERLGYFEEAADSYAEARLLAGESADRLETSSGGAITLTPQVRASGWGALGTLFKGLAEGNGQLQEELEMARAALELRAGRLDGVEKGLDEAGSTTEALTAELIRMDKELYHYLDIIPARALFPKKQRARVDRVMNRQEWVQNDLRRTEEALMELAGTRAWDRADDELKKQVADVWERLRASGSQLANAQLHFLEGLKFRVSVREKELMRLVEARKQENQALVDPLKDAREILVLEREKLAGIEAKFQELAERAAAAQAEMARLRGGSDVGLVEAARNQLLEQARATRLRADAYALDEVQALHLWEESLESEGEQ